MQTLSLSKFLFENTLDLQMQRLFKLVFVYLLFESSGEKVE